MRLRSRGGVYASVCAVVEQPDGKWRYTVEFNDGSSVDVDEEELDSAPKCRSSRPRAGGPDAGWQEALRTEDVIALALTTREPAICAAHGVATSEARRAGAVRAFRRTRLGSRPARGELGHARSGR